jgi:hypothetical protein
LRHSKGWRDAAGTVAKKPQTKASGELNETIVVPFMGMFKDPAGKPTPHTMSGNAPGDEPSVDDLLRVAASAQLEKLRRLADHYGIDRSGPEGWGLQLALQIAIEHHPGFEVVYDDWRARLFHSLHGFTPLFELKGKKPKKISDSKSWASVSKFLQPEVLALLVSRDRKSNLTDEQICEKLVIGADKTMGKRMNQLQKRQRTATLIRRLSEGRKRRKNKGI